MATESFKILLVSRSAVTTSWTLHQCSSFTFCDRKHKRIELHDLPIHTADKQQESDRWEVLSMCVSHSLSTLDVLCETNVYVLYFSILIAALSLTWATYSRECFFCWHFSFIYVFAIPLQRSVVACRSLEFL